MKDSVAFFLSSSGVSEPRQGILETLKGAESVRQSFTKAL